MIRLAFVLLTVIHFYGHDAGYLRAVDSLHAICDIMVPIMEEAIGV